jgi:hypothetical protein
MFVNLLLEVKVDSDAVDDDNDDDRSRRFNYEWFFEALRLLRLWGIGELWIPSLADTEMLEL